MHMPQALVSFPFTNRATVEGKSPPQTRAAPLHVLHKSKIHNVALLLSCSSTASVSCGKSCAYFRILATISTKGAEVDVEQLTMRTNQERLSVRLMAAVMAKPAKPALTGSSADTVTAAANTTVLLMKSILIASHLFMTCIVQVNLWRSCCSHGTRKSWYEIACLQCSVIQN